MTIGEQIERLNNLIDRETDTRTRNAMRHQLRNLEYRLNRLREEA
jgi:RNA polymerase-binding transcription factor DksA